MSKRRHETLPQIGCKTVKNASLVADCGKDDDVCVYRYGGEQGQKNVGNRLTSFSFSVKFYH